MKLYSNEIVFRGHPDKVCDQISDALLDAYMDKDQFSRCGIEVVGGKGVIFVTGEVTSRATVDVKQIVRRVLSDVGYPIHYQVIDNIGIQSKDIALGTNEEVCGAGDNGMMFGYAINTTPQMLPKAMVILQQLSMWYDGLRQRDLRFLPDGKAQITGVYDNRFNLIGIKDFTICYQNTEENREETDAIIGAKVKELCETDIDSILINPTGKFKVGGFIGDAGLTGRKIVVDNYQSFANVGGGAFSGKDPTKVDRSGAYKAREIAKAFLQELGLEWCEVQLSYAIGMPEPLAIYIDSNIGFIEVDHALYENCAVSNIINDLGLRTIKFEPLARFGHFM